MIDHLWFPVEYCRGCSWSPKDEEGSERLVIIGGLSYCGLECRDEHLKETGWFHAYRWEPMYDDDNLPIQTLKRDSFEGALALSLPCLPLEVS